MDRRAKRQIIQLLSVLLGAFFAAGVAMVWMVHSWSPIGTYLAKNVLIAPNVAEQMMISQYNRANREKNWVVFDRVVFTYFDGKEYKIIKVGKDAYAKFYQLAGNDRSLPEVSQEIIKLFNNQANLVIEVRNKSSKERIATPFQELAFAAGGDYYRVELHQDSPAGNFVYFHHPQIYNKARAIFNHE
jgi:hypothetical protein